MEDLYFFKSNYLQRNKQKPNLEARKLTFLYKHPELLFQQDLSYGIIKAFLVLLGGDSSHVIGC